MTRCARCPVSPDLVCPGSDVRRFCELADPDHCDHRPAYRDTLVSMATGSAAGPFEAEIGAAVDDTPCCGGANPLEYLI